MDGYVVALALIGFAALGMAWMPAFTRLTGISYSIVYILLGVVLYGVFDFLPDPDPINNKAYTLHLTELVVIISLMGTGLKIDKPFSLRTWTVPFRLVTITMLLGIAAVALLGYYFFDLDLSSALLLGAVLAPTDPVLASDVQVGPPNQKDQEHARFPLTAEAGLNDGMAFPFVWLAIALASTTSATGEILTGWFLYDLLYRLIAGILVGFVIGRLLAYFLFRSSEKRETIDFNDGFVAVSATLLVYGLTEILHGYGFIAVFVASITLRNFELDHKYHAKLHSFTDQIERTLLAIVLILFGGGIIREIGDGFTYPVIVFALLLVFVVRPVTAMIGLIGVKLQRKAKLVISFFGIKGIGSFYYLAFAISQVGFTFRDEVWVAASATVFFSVIVHGLTATRTMRVLDKHLEKRAKSDKTLNE